MRHFAMGLLLAVLIAAAPLMGAKPAKPEAKGDAAAAKGAKYHPGVVHGQRLLAVSREGRLVSTDLVWGSPRDYGAFDAKLGPSVDVEGGLACVASDEHVLVVSLSSGKIVHSLKREKGPARVGFAGPQRVYAVCGATLQIFDLPAGKEAHRLSLAFKQGDKPVSRGLPPAPWGNAPLPACRQGGLLYVATPIPFGVSRSGKGKDYTTLGGVAAIDLNTGKVVDQKSVITGITGIQVAGDKLFVRFGGYSYGMLIESIRVLPLGSGKINVASKEARSIRLPYDIKSVPSSGMAVTSKGQLIVAGGPTVYCYGADGKLAAKSAPSLSKNIQMVAVWKDLPVLAGEGGIRRSFPMSPVAKAAKPATRKTD